jgi:alkanesulfonate monooxygenase SsuD/methylene tetrahydromethanopterin reductase-like flavin-dependent oxidoreductase (luciferase family)
MWFGDHVCMPMLSSSAHVANAPGQRAYESRHNMVDVAVTMSAIAAGTTTLRLGPSVIIAPYRDPLSDACQFATVDILSGGRLIFGVGAGWMKEEFDEIRREGDRLRRRRDSQRHGWYRTSRCP